MVASALCFFFILTALMVLRPARETLGMRLRGTSSDGWWFLWFPSYHPTSDATSRDRVGRYRRGQGASPPGRAGARPPPPIRRTGGSLALLARPGRRRRAIPSSLPR